MEADNNLASALASEPINIGKWTFYPDKLHLECGDEEVKLEPRVAKEAMSMLFLCALETEGGGLPLRRKLP